MVSSDPNFFIHSANTILTWIQDITSIKINQPGKTGDFYPGIFLETFLNLDIQASQTSLDTMLALNNFLGEFTQMFTNDV